MLDAAAQERQRHDRVEAHQQDGEGARLHRDGNRDDDHLGVGPEHRQRHRQARAPRPTRPRRARPRRTWRGAARRSPRPRRSRGSRGGTSRRPAAARPPSPASSRPSELARRCSRSAWTNMYVTKVHGRLSALAGSNASARNAPSEVKTVSSSKSTTAFAMMSRVTHGVIRGWEIACMPARLSTWASCSQSPSDRSGRTVRGIRFPLRAPTGEAGSSRSCREGYSPLNRRPHPKVSSESPPGSIRRA